MRQNIVGDRGKSEESFRFSLHAAVREGARKRRLQPCGDGLHDIATRKRSDQHAVLYDRHLLDSLGSQHMARFVERIIGLDGDDMARRHVHDVQIKHTCKTNLGLVLIGETIQIERRVEQRRFVATQVRRHVAVGHEAYDATRRSQERRSFRSRPASGPRRASSHRR